MIPNEQDVSFFPLTEISQSTVPVVDVRTEQAFHEAHLPNAVNICVYESVFVDKIREAFPDVEGPLILMGQGGSFKADRVAWSRLKAAGYRQVSVLEGGLDAYRDAGGKIETHPLQPLSRQGIYSLDPEACRVHWIGRNLLNQHSGTIAADSGELEINEAGLPLRGSITVDMTRMICEDLEDPNMAQMLIGHLMSIDFFEVAGFPTASFSFETATPIAGANPGAPNYRLQGRLSARGKEIALQVDALVAETENGFVLKSIFDFDRTLVGAVYGSGKFFERLGMHMVQDVVSMDIRCIFRKNS